MSNKGFNLGFVPSLETIRLQSGCLASPFEFVGPSPSDFVNGEKQSNEWILLSNEVPFIVGLPNNDICPKLPVTAPTSQEMHPLGAVEKGMSQTLDSIGNEDTVVFIGYLQARATLEYFLNSPIKGLDNSESCCSLCLSNVSATYSQKMPQRTSFTVGANGNEPSAFELSLIFILHIPSPHLTMQREPMNSYTILLILAVNNRGVCFLFLTDFPTVVPAQVMES